MSPFVLDEHRGLFRDEESFARFVTLFSSQMGQDFSPVISGDAILGAVLSPEATKDFLYERMIRRMSSNPKLLDEIRDRIENDEIVE